jgi:D-3-phosphoglycerate dehydrogenase
MYKLLISDKIPDSAVGILHSNPNYDVRLAYGLEKEQLIKEIRHYHGLIVRSATVVSKDIIDAGEILKVIGRAGSGLDNIDMDYARSKGIVVLNTPGSNALAVAELTVAMMFSLARRLYPAINSMKNKRWEKSNLTGSEISGKTIGFVGFGQIGQKVGRIAAGLNMQILVHKTRPVLKSPGYEFEVVPLDTLLAKSDYVTLHVPKSEQTTNLITLTELKKMKTSAFLINCARGGIINEKDLLYALDQGIIAGAGLDVFETEPPVNHRLIQHERVIATPHIGGASVESQERVGEDIVRAVMGYLETNYLFL